MTFFFFQEDSAQVHCACNSPTEWKMQFLCFRVLPGSAEAHIIWGGKVKRLLIPYFISNISAKKYQKCIHVCQSYSKPKVGHFSETQCILYVTMYTVYAFRYWENFLGRTKSSAAYSAKLAGHVAREYQQ